MTFTARAHWPAIAERRRAVIETRTASGDACTIVIEREQDGAVLVSFHGAWSTTAAPCRQELDELLAALADAAK